LMGLTWLRQDGLDDRTIRGECSLKSSKTLNANDAFYGETVRLAA